MLRLRIFLPTADHPARQHLGDIGGIAEILAPENRDKLPLLRDALPRHRDWLASTKGAESLTAVAVKLSGHVVLEEITPTTHRTLWVFGQLGCETPINFNR